MSRSFIYDNYSEVSPAEAIIIIDKVGDNFKYAFEDLESFEELENYLKENGQIVYSYTRDQDDRITYYKIYEFEGFLFRFRHSEFKYTNSDKKGEPKKAISFNVSVIIFSRSEELLPIAIEIASKRIVKKDPNKNLGKINILIEQNGSLDITYIENDELSDIEFDNYREDFREKVEELVKICNEQDKGIGLLHGLPGTGKSTFLKGLAKKIPNKKLIFIPPSFSHVLSNPDFITFMLEHKNSILIIEDAETVLKTRKGSENHAVSNILNLTDGLLSNLLELQILCTLNCNVNYIDEAVRRPGRLIFEYDFKKLEIDQCNRLLTKLYEGKNYKTSKELTIAEIYNFETLKPEEKKKIGFNG